MVSLLRLYILLCKPYTQEFALLDSTDSLIDGFGLYTHCATGPENFNLNKFGTRNMTGPGPGLRTEIRFGPGPGLGPGPGPALGLGPGP